MHRYRGVPVVALEDLIACQGLQKEGDRFGGPDDPGVATLMEGYQARTGRDPRELFAMGDAAVIMERLRAYVDAGASKFILRPIGADDEDLMDQTRRLIEEVLPATAARWPRS